MKIIDKLLDRLAGKVVERMENKNTVMLDANKINENFRSVEVDEDKIRKLLKGDTVKIKSHDIKISERCFVKNNIGTQEVYADTSSEGGQLMLMTEERENNAIDNILKLAIDNNMTIYNLKECTDHVIKEMENNALISPPSK